MERIRGLVTRAQKSVRHTPKISLAVLAGAVIVLGGFGWWLTSSPALPLPAAVAKQVKDFDFTPYFVGTMPDGFTMDEANVSYQQGVLIIPFTTTSKHDITLTEQKLPANISFDILLGQGTVLDGAPGQAALNNVEGRNLVSIISSNHKTLLLINSSDASAAEVTALAKSLHQINK